MEYLSVPTPMSATVSACLSLEKYFCSFSNKISCVISESIPVPYFEDEEKRCSWQGKTIFLLSKTLRSQRAKEEIWPILSAVLQLHCIRSIKPNNIISVDCGLRTVDNGFWTTPLWKNSSAHIVILKKFLSFAIAKREISPPLTPPCCEAWPPRLGNRGESPLKVKGMFVAFHRGRSCTFWVFNIFNHRGTAYSCA